MLNKTFEYIAQAHDTFDDHGKLRVRLPKIESLALYLGVNKDTLYEWAKHHVEFSDALQRIREMQAERLIDRALEGTYNHVISKLLLHNHGYSDKTETEVSGSLSLLDLAKRRTKTKLDEDDD